LAITFSPFARVDHSRECRNYWTDINEEGFQYGSQNPLLISKMVCFSSWNDDGTDPPLGSPENRFGRHTQGFKPAADIDLGVGFATEMPGAGAIGGSQIPLDDCKSLISAFDHKPMDRIVTDDPANLALEFL
jgi:hypothetical protein